MCGGDAVFLSNYFDHLLYYMLLKALGDKADLRTDATLKKVETFLKLCNKNAAETFFG